MRQQRVVRYVAALITSLVSSPLSAQATGTVLGTVTGVDGRAVGEATVRIRGTALAVVTSPDGTFRLLAVPPRNQTLDVRMLGFQPYSETFEIASNDTLHLRIVLAAVPQLDTVAVVSDPIVSPAMQAFAQRRARGPGVFFGVEEIRRMQPRVFTDILRRVPGLQVRPVRGGMANNVSVQTRGSECPVLFFMNGIAFPLPGDQPINDFIPPEEVIGIEVYSGSSEIPAQFNSSRFNARCGVIVIWTRYGPEERR